MPFMSLIQHLRIRARPRLFDQVGHETMYASSRNKHFSLNLQTHQNYEESRQKLGAELGNKVP